MSSKLIDEVLCIMVYAKKWGEGGFFFFVMPLDQYDRTEKEKEKNNR